MRKTGVRLIAIALALSIGAMPGTALAALQAPQGNLPQSSQEVTTQAKKETVYVVTGVKEGTGSKTTYSYNKKGLVSKRVTNYAGNRDTLTWKYDKSNNLKSIDKTYYDSGNKSTSTEVTNSVSSDAVSIHSFQSGDAMPAGRHSLLRTLPALTVRSMT